ncbi:alpha/beta hydrolase [Dokdonella sp.]|uniref:alpha/beta hydrolase n=1 Tax=Dokdonella sp. TaxID=2291710 RepID=UPI003C3FB127
MSLREWFIALIIVCAGVGDKVSDAGEPVLPHETLNIESRVLAEKRVVNVWVPPGYAAGKEKGGRYPVLYMPDGGVGEDFPHVVSTVDSLVRAGEIPPMLVVGIENTQRRRDMTGPTKVAEDRKIAAVVGGSAAFRSFIADELKPLIRKRYAANEESAIIGESAAALFIVETLFLQPELFNIYIALDPSLWWNNEQWSREAGARLKRMGDVQVSLLLASANEQGNRQVTMNLVQVLCQQPESALQWSHAPHPELGHDTIYRTLEKDLLKQAFSGTIDSASACAGSE